VRGVHIARGTMSVLPFVAQASGCEAAARSLAGGRERRIRNA
jgi:hypothetical protein